MKSIQDLLFHAIHQNVRCWLLLHVTCQVLLSTDSCTSLSAKHWLLKNRTAKCYLLFWNCQMSATYTEQKTFGKHWHPQSLFIVKVERIMRRKIWEQIHFRSRSCLRKLVTCYLKLPEGPDAVAWKQTCNHCWNILPGNAGDWIKSHSLAAREDLYFHFLAHWIWVAATILYSADGEAEWIKWKNKLVE